MSKKLLEFLTGVGLPHRYQDFMDNGIDQDVVADLSDADLREVGLNLGERKRFLKASLELTPEETSKDASGGPERRQLTVMFIDLVGSTALSAATDVEDFRAVVTAYQETCTSVIQAHGGTVAKYMGDGILAYFGYPETTEHSAEQAARAGLEIIGKVSRLNPIPNVTLSTRVGAATGQVIVGDLIGSGPSQERQVVGDTPNLAARLQAIASPDEFIIGDLTCQLVKALFKCEPKGAQDIKGFDQPVECFTVEFERQVGSRFRAARVDGGLAPLRGRKAELDGLLEQWTNSLGGQLNMALIGADPGFGKSRLLAALEEDLSSQQHVLVAFYCHPQFNNSTLRPFVDYLGPVFDWQREDGFEDRFNKMSAVLTDAGLADDVAIFATILGIPPDGLYSPRSESAQLQRAAFATAVAKLLVFKAGSAPLLILFEDLHWADATTLEILGGFLDGLTDQPVFFVATSRNADALQLSENPKVNLVRLGVVSANASHEIAQQVAGSRELPKEVMNQILSQAEGNPLFLEELTKGLLESDSLVEKDGELVMDGPIAGSLIPTTLQDSLMARLDRVTTAKEVAQISSVFGREFSLDLLLEVCPHSPRTIEANLAILEDAEIVFPIEGSAEKSWIFKHALIQEAAYESLLRSRRRELHNLIAGSYEKLRKSELTTIPEIMAHHLSRAEEFDRAIEFGLSASMGALVRSANTEALAHAKSCQNWTGKLADKDQRGPTELKVQAIMTPALMQTQGYSSPDVQESARRGLELLEIHGDSPEAFPNLLGLTMFHHVRSERQLARNFSERFVSLAEKIDAGNQLVAGLPLVGQCSWIEGNLKEAEEELQRGMSLYDPEAHRMHGAQYGFDSFSYCQITLSQVLMMKGRITEAMEAAEASLAHARNLEHTNTIGISMLYVTMIKQQLGMRDVVAKETAEALEYCAQMGVTTPTSYIAMIANWAQNNVEGSREIYGVHDMLGAWLGMTYYRSLGAENSVDMGDFKTAQEILDPALEQARTTGEEYWLPELLRLQARIDAGTGADTGRKNLEEAVAAARTSGALLLEALAIRDLLKLGGEDSALLSARMDELCGPLGVQMPEAVMESLLEHA